MPAAEAEGTPRSSHFCSVLDTCAGLAPLDAWLPLLVLPLPPPLLLLLPPPLTESTGDRTRTFTKRRARGRALDMAAERTCTPTTVVAVAAAPPVAATATRSAEGGAAGPA